MQEQLQPLSISLKKALNSPVDVAMRRNWTAEFFALENLIATLSKKKNLDL